MTRLEKYVISKWEYWPQAILHLPTALFYTFFSLRSRSFLFFTNISNDYINSNIENSSKNYVYSRLNQAYYPQTILVTEENKTSIDDSQLKALRFPIIAKPNIGKRGLAATLVNDKKELEAYSQNATYDFVLQEYISYANECGIFYIKIPNQSKGRITSIGIKKLVSVTGDGSSTLQALINLADIHLSPANTIARRYDLNKTILPHGEVLVLEPIGSHNRGTRVRSGDHHINDQLLSVIEKSLEGFELYYGRLDIKYDNWRRLLEGDFKIIEINTITSEPLSMYDLDTNLIDKYKMLYRHIRDMYRISTQLKKQGRLRLSISEFIKYIRSYNSHLKQISTSQL